MENNKHSSKVLLELSSQNNKFIRVKQLQSKIKFYFCEISWPHPHERKENWKKIKEIDASATDEVVKFEINQIIKDKQFFSFLFKMLKSITIRSDAWRYLLPRMCRKSFGNYLLIIKMKTLGIPKNH